MLKKLYKSIYIFLIVLGVISLTVNVIIAVHDSSKYRELPNLIRAILFDCDAYLVGSGALWYIEGGKQPKDLDVILKKRRGWYGI